MKYSILKPKLHKFPCLCGNVSQLALSNVHLPRLITSWNPWPKVGNCPSLCWSTSSYVLIIGWDKYIQILYTRFERNGIWICWGVGILTNPVQNLYRFPIMIWTACWHGRFKAAGADKPRSPGSPRSPRDIRWSGGLSAYRHLWAYHWLMGLLGEGQNLNSDQCSPSLTLSCWAPATHSSRKPYETNHIK